MTTCQDCGEPISARRKRCPDCKKADHARVMREVRAANSGQQGWSPESSALGSELSDGRSVPNPYPWSTPYKPGPAAPAPEAVDYTQGGHSAPGVRATPDLSRVPNRVRQDRVAYEKEMLRAEFGADDADLMPDNDMMTWDSIQARNSRGDDGRVMFPAQGELRQHTIFSSPLPNVDYLGRSTRRPRSWR